jgi:hypothetical protein
MSGGSGAAALLACVALLVGAAACGDDDSGRGAACGATVEEPLDPGSAQHLLPGAPEPRYTTDPPTSGAHIVGNLPRGVVGEELPRPVQVALLEQGEVLIQYATRDPEERASLEALAGEHVTIAPRDGNPVVVATAWQRKLECTGIDTGMLRAFIDEHAGVGFGGGHS